MESVHVNGVELEYEVVGAGEPVLLMSPVLAVGFLPLLSEPATTHNPSTRTSARAPDARRANQP